MADIIASGGARRVPFVIRYPSVLVFLALLGLFTVGVTILSEGFGIGVISTSFVKTLGKTLCLCLVALAMDLVWGYTGILSLGHGAFFALGGYAMGMYLMRQIGTPERRKWLFVLCGPPIMLDTVEDATMAATCSSRACRRESADSAADRSASATPTRSSVSHNCWRRLVTSTCRAVISDSCAAACEAVFSTFYLFGSIIAGCRALKEDVRFGLPLRLLMGYAIVNSALLALAWLSPLGKPKPSSASSGIPAGCSLIGFGFLSTPSRSGTDLVIPQKS